MSDIAEVDAGVNQLALDVPAAAPAAPTGCRYALYSCFIVACVPRVFMQPPIDIRTLNAFLLTSLDPLRTTKTLVQYGPSVLK